MSSVGGNQQIGQCRWDQNDPVAEIIITMNPLYILNCPNRWLIAEITFLLDLLQCEHFQSSCACCLKKCFWIESFLHQISNWRYFGLGVIWEWNRLQISPSATCSLTFSLQPDSVWPAWKWDVIFVSAASSFLFLFLFLSLLLTLPPSSSFSPTSDVLLTSLDIYLTMSCWFCGFVIWWVAWCLTAAMSSQISSSRWARSRQPEPQITLTRCVGVFNLSFLIMNILNHRRDGLNQ